MKATLGLPAILASTALLFAYLLAIWWLDRYEREPFWLVVLVFGWGATIGVGGGCCLNTSIVAPFRDVLGAGASVGLATILVAPIVEEFTKGLVFFPLVWTDHFDNVTDGLIYGAASGLGFATVENLMYFANFMAGDMGVDKMLAAITMRTLFTAVMHCASSALLGMAVGYARHRDLNAKWIVYPAIGYLLAVGNHAAWNLLAILSGVHEGFRLLGAAVVVGAAALLFGITQWSLRREHAIIERFLAHEADRGLIPERHAEIIPYWTKRRRDDWVPDDIDREEYVEAATLLAFRHHQREIAPDTRADDYTDRIQKYRRRVRNHLP